MVLARARAAYDPAKRAIGVAVSTLEQRAAAGSNLSVSGATTGAMPGLCSQLNPNQKAVLHDWAVNHIDNPYPKPNEKKELVKITGLTMRYINNWFSNFRIRVWRPALKSLGEDPGLDEDPSGPTLNSLDQEHAGDDSDSEAQLHTGIKCEGKWDDEDIGGCAGYGGSKTGPSQTPTGGRSQKSTDRPSHTPMGSKPAKARRTKPAHVTDKLAVTIKSESEPYVPLPMSSIRVVSAGGILPVPSGLSTTPSIRWAVASKEVLAQAFLA